MSGQTNLSISASTFQNGSQYYPQRYFGDNFTTVGLNISNKKIRHWSLYTGVSMTAKETEIPENGEPGAAESEGNQFQEPSYGFTGDIKCSYPLYRITRTNGLDISFSLNGRARTNVSFEDGTTKTALRLAAEANIPLSDKSSIYIDPYVLTSVDYGNLTKDNFKEMLGNNLRFGAFLGGKRKFKIGNYSFTAFAESQFYNIGKNIEDCKNDQPMDWSTVSFNAGFNFPLNFGKK